MWAEPSVCGRISSVCGVGLQIVNYYYYHHHLIKNPNPYTLLHEGKQEKRKQGFIFLSFLHNFQLLDLKKGFISSSAIVQEGSGEFVLWQGYLN